MQALRVIIFNILFYGGSLFWGIVLIWALPFPQRVTHRLIHFFYGDYIAFICRAIMGIKLEIRGKEHLPKQGGYIIAAKHQSAYETVLMPFIIPLTAIVFKRELMFLPFWGWYPPCMGFVPIDRGSAQQAITSIIRGAKKMKEQGRPLVIFPQGTRVPVGEKRPYKFGLAKVYEESGMPIVPMALNSGVYWPKNSFLKKPGTIVFEFLPAIKPGLPPRQMMALLEEMLEPASDRLAEEALNKAA